MFIHPNDLNLFHLDRRKILQSLIENGADVTLKDNDGKLLLLEYNIKFSYLCKFKVNCDIG